MAKRPTPRYYILHGQEALSRTETLDRLQARLGPPELVALNTTVLDGAEVSLAALQNACNTIPFMAQRRLVIVRGLLTRLVTRPKGKGKRSDLADWQKRYLEGLSAYLPHLPDTTRLVFVETVSLPDNHPILRQAQGDERAFVRHFALPKDFVTWVRRRAADKGGEISPQAATALVQAVGQAPRLLDQELEKLLAFANWERPVTSEDVILLVPYAQEAVIFEAVDALGHRDGVKAARLLHNLLAHGNDPLYLLAMIARQFRLLIQVKELAEEGLGPPAIAQAIKLHPYPTRKLYVQARNFAMDQLERVHRHLLKIDLQVKTGQMDSVVALDLLIAALSTPHSS